MQGGFVEQLAGGGSFAVSGSLAAGSGPDPQATLSLEWDAQPGALLYRVWCGLAPDRMPLQAEVEAGHCSIAGLRASQPYFFQVTAVLSPRASLASPVYDSLRIPGAPANLVVAHACDGRLELAWDAVGGASYSLFQGASPGAEVLVQSGLTAPAAVVTGLANGVPCYFVVRAGIGGFSSGNSNEVYGTPLANLPPAGLSALPDLARQQIDLGWTASATAASYNVYQGSAPGAEGAVPVATGLVGTSFAAPGPFAPDQAYYFTVRAVNGCGQVSAASGEASAALSAYAMNVLAGSPEYYVRGADGVNIGTLGSAANAAVGSSVVAGAPMLARDPQTSAAYIYGDRNAYQWTVNQSLGNLLQGDCFVEFWIDSNGGNDPCVYGTKQATGDGAGMYINQSLGAGGGFGISYNNVYGSTAYGTGDVRSAQNLSDNNRYHVVANVKSGSAAEIFVNAIGVSDVHTPIAYGPTAPNGVSLGSWYNGGFFGSFNGIQQEVVISSGSLSPAQVLLRYAIGSNSGWGLTDYSFYTANIGIARSGGDNNIATRGSQPGQAFKAQTTAFFGADLEYLEFSYDTVPASPAAEEFSCGITTYSSQSSSPVGVIGTYAGGEVGYSSNGTLRVNNVASGGHPALGAGSVVGYCVDNVAGQGWILVDGVSIGGDPQAGTSPAFTFTPGASWRGALALTSSGAVAHTTQRAGTFAFAPPARFPGVLGVVGS
jgi:hypothetical protein